MPVQRFQDEAERCCAAMVSGPRIIVIGSTSFWGADSRELCEAVARELARVPALVAVTGGMSGVGMTFGQAFSDARLAAGLPENLYHILPRAFWACPCGVTLEAGDDFEERREILGRVAGVFLVIEGGPGTAHEAEVAAAHGAAVLSLGRTGGHAGELFARRVCPANCGADDWQLLGAANAPHGDVVAAVRALVLAALGTTA